MTDIAPGLYFGMDEAVYHAAPALSSSGIKNLLISPMDFWARCPWLNPDVEDEDTTAKALGKAYDTRITEGRERFYELYAAALDPADYPNALRTMDEIREALPEGAPKSGSKTALRARLLQHQPDAEIWDDLVGEHAEHHGGKTLLPPDIVRRIEIAAAMIEKHPQLCKAFTGGYPQVSIFWDCPETGVRMKCRTDYLKTKAVVDLKTFSNPLGKPIDRAVTYAMAAYKYHLQTAVYLEGIEAAKEMLRENGPDVAHGDVDIEWLETLASNEDFHRFMFVFQQTGIAPVARGYELPRALTYDCGKVAVYDAKRLYAYYCEKYGTGPWVDEVEIRTFDDTEFPAFMTEV